MPCHFFSEKRAYIPAKLAHCLRISIFLKANDIQGSTVELRKLRTEERMLERLLKEANVQLTQLKVEALEIKNRTRQGQVQKRPD